MKGLHEISCHLELQSWLQLADGLLQYSPLSLRPLLNRGASSGLWEPGNAHSSGLWLNYTCTFAVRCSGGAQLPPGDATCHVCGQSHSLVVRKWLSGHSGSVRHLLCPRRAALFVPPGSFFCLLHHMMSAVPKVLSAVHWSFYPSTIVGKLSCDL